MRKQRNIARLFILTIALVGVMSSITLMTASVRSVSAQVAAPAWTLTGSLNANRYLHTATLLPNGKVLVVGGGSRYCSPRCYLPTNDSAELYDPATGIWSYTGSLNNRRFNHQAVLLSNGQVLVTGGYNSDDNLGHFTSLNSAELYDPATGNWRLTGGFIAIRPYTATLLPNGKVLVAGSAAAGGPAASAELYDPTTATWSSTSVPSAFPFGLATVTLLPNGKVLATGPKGYHNPAMAALYDADTETWNTTGNFNLVNSPDTATLLQNGKVLATGTRDNANPAVAVAELYDPTTGTWSVTGNLNTIFWSGPTLLLPNGKVLMAGGSDSWDDSLDSAELYDPTTGTWSPTSNLLTSRQWHTATLLPNGKVLVAGGVIGDPYDDFPNPLSCAELYTPAISIINQIDDAPFFVRQHYRDFLNREPDADGLAFWTNEITSCGSDQSCVEVKRINDSASFFLSIEFQETGYLVYRFYKASYGNAPGAPVPLRLNEFLPDTKEIGQGVVVNQSGWEQLLEINKQAFATEFVQRSRFVSAYPTSMSSEQFVDALFANAGVTPSASDRAAVINEFPFAATSADVVARAHALRRVAENSTLAQQEFNRAFVLMQYFGYLRRNPSDAPDGNFDGYNFWLNKLNSFNGNYIQAEMVKAFLSSTEYRKRFGP